MITLLTILCFLLSASVVPIEATGFAVAEVAVPVLNSPDFSRVFGGNDGRSLKTDSCGQVRELEYIALPGTVFRVLDELRPGRQKLLRVESDEYPAPAGVQLYVDSRFVRFSDKQPAPREKGLQKRQEIVAAMRSAAGLPYVWGGNLRNGVPEMTKLYYRGMSSEAERRRLTLSGLDCSGLLYEATDGWTPRNTSVLVRFGDGVPVSGLSADAIAARLEPLDLIVWNGHVLIVLDRDSVIESRLECGRPGNGGVVISPLKRRLAGIMKTRKPADEWPAGGKKRGVFVVRRWYPI